MMGISPFHQISKVLNWDLLIVEVVWVQWTHCHIKETWGDLSFVTWIILLEAAINRWVHSDHKGMEMVGNITQVMHV